MRRGVSNGVAVSNTIPILLPVGIEGTDVVAQGLVVPAMPFILLAVLQKVTVKLLEVILGERNI